MQPISTGYGISCNNCVYFIKLNNIFNISIYADRLEK